MERSLKLTDISIRNEIRPGDLGFVIYRHGKLYGDEYQYGVEFETYVAAGISDFYRNYDPASDRAWICEDRNTIVGFLLFIHKENKNAQLRFFYLEPPYRGIGLGRKLMELFIQHLKNIQCVSCYLWTTQEQEAAAHLYKKFGFVLTEEKPSSSFGKKIIEQKYVLNVN